MKFRTTIPDSRQLCISQIVLKWKSKQIKILFFFYFILKLHYLASALLLTRHVGNSNIITRYTHVAVHYMKVEQLDIIGEYKLCGIWNRD